MSASERAIGFVLVLIAAGVVAFSGRPSLPPDPPATVTTPVAEAPAAEPAVCEMCGKDCKCKPGECTCKEPLECNPPTVKLRKLTSDEFVRLLEKHVDAWEKWVAAQPGLPGELTMRELMDLWLLENPQHDLRLEKPKAVPTLFTEPKLTQPSTTCKECNGAGANRINGVWVRCPVCKGDGTIDDDPRDPEAQPGFKPTSHQPPTELFTHPQPTVAKEPEYMKVRVPYTVSAGLWGRRSYTAYREEMMLKSEYEARVKAAAAKPKATTYYRYYSNGCAGGRCGR